MFVTLCLKCLFRDCIQYQKTLFFVIEYMVVYILSPKRYSFKVQATMVLSLVLVVILLPLFSTIEDKFIIFAYNQLKTGSGINNSISPHFGTYHRLIEYKNQDNRIVRKVAFNSSLQIKSHIRESSNYNKHHARLNRILIFRLFFV